MTEIIEKIIEGENVDRVRHVGTVKFKSDKEGFKDQTFERYSFQGETFRVRSSEIKFQNDYSNGDIHKIWLVLKKGVILGVDDKGKDITRDLWEYDGHQNIKSAETKAEVKAKLERIAKSYGDVADVVKLQTDNVL